jgi:hypothetical protein
MDPDPDPGVPKTYGYDGSGSATLLSIRLSPWKKIKDLVLPRDGKNIYVIGNQ